MSIQDPIAQAAAIAVDADMRVTSLNDMIGRLVAEAGPTTGRCVERINIWNHGRPGFQVVAGEEPVCVRDLQAPATETCPVGYREVQRIPRSGFDLEWLLSTGNQATLARLRSVFCCEATMGWLGCGTAGVSASGGLRTDAERRGSGREGGEVRWAASRFGDYGHRYQSMQEALAHGASASGAVFGLATVQAWADGTCTTITASNDFTFFDPSRPRQLYHVGYGGSLLVTPPSGPGHCSCNSATGRVQGALNVEEERGAIFHQREVQLGGDHLWHVHLRAFRELLRSENRGRAQAQIERALQTLIEDVAPQVSIPSGLPRAGIQPWLSIRPNATWSGRVQPHLALCFPDNCWRWVEINERAIQTTPEYTQFLLGHEFLHASDIWEAAQVYRQVHGDPPAGAGARCVPVVNLEEIHNWTDPWGRYVAAFWDSVTEASAGLRHVNITSTVSGPLFSRFTAVEKARWFQAVMGELPPNVPASETFVAEQTVLQIFLNPDPREVALREEMGRRLNDTARILVFGNDTHPADIGRARSVLSHFLPVWQPYLRQRALLLEYIRTR